MMYFKKFFLTLSIFFIFCTQVFAKTDYANIDWYKLNLSIKQAQQIKALDRQWQDFSSEVRGQVYRDQQSLQSLLAYPYISDNEIRVLQWKIVMKQQHLRDQALENFLKKRRILNKTQLKKLHEMLST